MKLEYKEEETVKDILGFRFATSNSTFNYSINENKCFFTVSNQSSENEMCLKNGIMDLAPCVFLQNHTHSLQQMLDHHQMRNSNGCSYHQVN